MGNFNDYINNLNKEICKKIELVEKRTRESVMRKYKKQAEHKYEIIKKRL